MEVADLEAEMYEVLFKCVLKYNPDNGASFNTFIWQAIYNRFRSIMRYQNASKRAGKEVPFSLTTYDDDDENNDHNYRSMDQLCGSEASTEETFFAIARASELMSDPRMQTRIRSSRQFAHVPA